MTQLVVIGAGVGLLAWLIWPRRVEGGTRITAVAGLRG